MSINLDEFIETKTAMDDYFGSKSNEEIIKIVDKTFSQYGNINHHSKLLTIYEYLILNRNIMLEYIYEIILFNVMQLKEIYNQNGGYKNPEFIKQICDHVKLFVEKDEKLHKILDKWDVSDNQINSLFEKSQDIELDICKIDSQYFDYCYKEGFVDKPKPGTYKNVIIFSYPYDF